MTIKTVGSRAEVMHGTAKHTSGGLTKADLMYNKHNRIVSRKKAMNKNTLKRLTDRGFHTCKGFFGAITTPEEMSVKCNAKDISRISRHVSRHASRKSRRSRR